MNRARVLVADDHMIVMEGLVTLLKERFDVVGTVADGAALVDAALRLNPDVIVTDISMPVLSGLEAMERLRSRGATARFVFLTMHSEPEVAARAIRQGASAFLLKAAAGEDLLHAIEETLQGRVYLSPAVTKGVLEILQTVAETPRQPQLTERQRDVLRLIAEGKRMKEVASILGLSRRTVETHKYEMMRTLGFQSTAELIRYALQHGLD